MDRIDHTSEEDQGQFIDIFDSHKNHERHEAQHNGTVHTHVVEEGCLSLCPLQAIKLENGCLRNNVNLKMEMSMCYTVYSNIFIK